MAVVGGPLLEVKVAELLGQTAAHNWAWRGRRDQPVIFPRRIEHERAKLADHRNETENMALILGNLGKPQHLADGAALHVRTDRAVVDANDRKFRHRAAK